jgi:DNA mismatch repair protein MutH
MDPPNDQSDVTASDAEPADTVDPLTRLSELLRKANQQGEVSVRYCAEIDKVHAELEKRAMSGSSNYEPRDLQVEAVLKFWNTGAFESLREARLVSFGLAIRPWSDRRCLIEEPERFDAALTGLREWEDSPRQFRKCYQGLLRSYFDYDGLGRDVPAEGQKSWNRLQTYLDDRANFIKDTTINPDWVTCALENRGLFSETPCAAFAQDVLDGREENVRLVRNLLGISDASWFTRELVLSQIARACKHDHGTFCQMVDQLLALLGDNEVLRDRGLQMMLNRYAQVPQTPQHLRLKDYSVNAWGNPWLPSNVHKWEGVTSEARQMVGDWLKLEFIELFFTKLAQDGLSDTRRVKFWTRYVPLIENIHFALGSHAMFSPERDFAELRKKLKGLTVSLEDNRPYNNAFVMTMGDLVAVEFSGTANAFYGYSVKRSLPFSLLKPVRSSPVNGRNSLKNDSRVLYLTHQDNVRGYSDWEERFKYELQDKFGLVPTKNQTRRVQAAAATTKKAAAAADPATTETAAAATEGIACG